jgi:NAD(P)-dependent dehydrogenase (short-subunit alcohol dehydrogenase family)
VRSPRTTPTPRAAPLPQTKRCLDGLVAIVTGAGRGIGRATAELFAAEGARVVLCSRTRQELDASVKAIIAAGGEAAGRLADIGRREQASDLVAFALRRYGGVDVLINNAGILGPRVPLTAYPARDWREVLRINLCGTFWVTQAAARVMTGQRNGCIISISSSVGRRGRAGWGAYAVAKFGVEGMSQVLAEELRPEGVRVFTFNPGGTRTAMRTAAYPEEDPRAPRPPDVPARALLRLVVAARVEDSGRSFDFESLP